MKIVVEIRLDGTLSFKNKDKYLSYKLIEKPAPIAPTRLWIGKGNRIHPIKPDKNHPWRNFVFSEKLYNFK